MLIEFITDDEINKIYTTDYKTAIDNYIDSDKLIVNVKSSHTALLYAATHIAKKSAGKACSTATQATIYNHCTTIYKAVGQYIKGTNSSWVEYSYTYDNNDDALTAAALSELIYSADNDPDAKEYISIAQVALIESTIKNMTVSDCILSAYRAVNTHINKLRTASEKERTQEYIRAQGGDLIAIDDFTARIIGTSRKEYIPSEPPTLRRGAADKQTEELGKIIKHIINTYLTPAQREIMLLLVKNCYSLQDIADIRGCNKATIYKHIVNIRYKISSYLYDNNIDIINSHNIDVSAIEGDYIRYNNYKHNYNKAIADKNCDKELEKKKLNEFVNKEYRQNKKRTDNNKN